MSNGVGKDVVRQAANVVGALFQAGMTTVASTRIQEVVDEGPPSLVEPAGYAFAIWALIFALSLAYAVYQALPTNRESPLLRRVGWFTATAFFFSGMWSVFVLLRQFLFAQAMLLGIFACLLVAYVRLARTERGVLSGAFRALVRPKLVRWRGRWREGVSGVRAAVYVERITAKGSRVREGS
jgi:hypothetical protein